MKDFEIGAVIDDSELETEIIEEDIEETKPIDESITEEDIIEDELIKEEEEEVKEEEISKTEDKDEYDPNVDFPLDEEEVEEEKDDFSSATQEEIEQLYIDLGSLGEKLKELQFEKQDFKNLQAEIKVFFEKKKDKKFIIYPTSYSFELFIYEYATKVMALVDFILIRNKYPNVTKKIYELTKNINAHKMKHYLILLESENEYGKNLIRYKMRREIYKQYDDIKRVIMLFFSAQPVKERYIPSSTVGVSKNVFDELTEE